MKNQVKEWVKNCDTCQRNKHESISPPGLLQPLPIPEQIWKDISMDFVEKLPVSQGKDTIWVVVDRLSKITHFISLKHPYTAFMVAQVFLEEVMKLYGLPKTIISDRDKIFISELGRVSQVAWNQAADEYFISSSVGWTN